MNNQKNNNLAKSTERLKSEMNKNQRKRTKTKYQRKLKRSQHSHSVYIE